MAAPAEDHPVSGWDKVMDLNVRGYFLLSQQVAKNSMIPNGGGRIINVSSIAGLSGNPPTLPTIAYNTSKAAVLGFTRTLAAEWGRYDITVNAICPGFFVTKLATGAIAMIGGEQAAAANAPLRRLGDDEDLKGITLLYASDAGKHITGQWLAVQRRPQRRVGRRAGPGLYRVRTITGPSRSGQHRPWPSSGAPCCPCPIG